MLKGAIYLNVFLFLIMAIYFLIYIVKENTDLKKIKRLIIVYIIFNFISLYLCNIEIVDIGWDLLFLNPMSIMAFVLYVISIFSINKQIRNKNYINNKVLSKKIYISLIVVPIIIFIIPYIYELYIINNCKYLLQYNYQNGIVISDDTYIAIINNKPVTITLQKNLFDRKGIYTEALNYDIVYDDNLGVSIEENAYNRTTLDDKIIKQIALDAKERCYSVKKSYIHYFLEEGYAIIELEVDGKIIEYFYYDGQYVKNINTLGSIENVIYYK